MYLAPKFLPMFSTRTRLLLMLTCTLSWFAMGENVRAQSNPYMSNYRSQQRILNHSNLMSALRANSNTSAGFESQQFLSQQYKPQQQTTFASGTTYIPSLAENSGSSEVQSDPFELAGYQSPEVSDIESPLSNDGPVHVPGPMQYNTHPEYDSTEETFVPNFDESMPCENCDDSPSVALEKEESGWVSVGSLSTITWVPAGSDEIGLTDIDFALSRMKLKRGTSTWIVDTGFQWHFVNGPTRTDLPSQLYNLRVNFMHMGQIGRQFGYQLAITPSMFTDFDNTSSDAWRFIGRALGFYYISPTTQLVGGVVYLDREDIGFLPAVGFITKPNDDVKIELIMPRPKVSYRYAQDDTKDKFIYLAGEFGGGSWAIERANRMDDIATYSDWRAVLGWEQKPTNGNGSTNFFEIGYVFNRELEYKSGIGDFDPSATFMLRSGARY